MNPRIQTVAALSLIATFIAACMVALPGCSGPAHKPVDSSSAPEETSAAVAEITAQGAPADVDGELYSELKQALILAVEQGRGMRAASVPVSDAGRVDDLEMVARLDGTVACSWTYRNQGDCDQNSEVNVSDLTPIGRYYRRTAAAPDWASARFADTNADGEVSVSDITPLGQNYRSRVSGYYIETSGQAAPDGRWERIAEAAFGETEPPAPGQARRFVHSLPGATAGAYYRVVPFNGDETGIAGSACEYTGEISAQYVVSGVCLDEAGAPLADVTVSFAALQAVTGADGSFAFQVENGTRGYLIPAMAGVNMDPPSRMISVDGTDMAGLEFRASALPAYALYIDPVLIAELDEELWAADYKPGDAVVGGELFAGVGIRYRGGAAMTFPKKSWKVDFTDEQYADPEWGYERGKLNLNAEYTDTTLMREKLTYDLIRDAGLLASRARFAKVYVNDEYAGLFTDVENPRRDWLEACGFSRDGSLYQAQSSQLKVLDSPAEYETAFEKQLLEDEPYDDLIAFVEALNSWQPGEIYAQLHLWMDMEQLRDYMVVYCLVSMGDQIETNYMLYHDIEETGLWSVIPWDHDRTWGHRWDPELGFFSLEIVDDTPIDYGSYRGDEEAWGNILYDRYLNDPRLWAEYGDALAQALENLFSEQRMIGRIDEYYSLIHAAALADENKWGDNADYDQRVEDLREYVRLRRSFIQSALN